MKIVDLVSGDKVTVTTAKGAVSCTVAGVKTNETLFAGDKYVVGAEVFYLYAEKAALAVDTYTDDLDGEVWSTGDVRK